MSNENDVVSVFDYRRKLFLGLIACIDARVHWKYWSVLLLKIMSYYLVVFFGVIIEIIFASSDYVYWIWQYSLFSFQTLFEIKIIWEESDRQNFGTV